MKKTPDKQSHPADFVKWFRGSAPYIHAFRGRSFVICFSGEMLMDGRFAHLAQDIALLKSLGIHLVLVHGGRPQIDIALQKQQIKPVYIDGERITDTNTLQCVTAVNGKIRVEIEAALSMGLANSPMAGAAIRVTSGNFVTARPVGIHRGIDFQHTGRVRKVDAQGIRACLESGTIALLSAIGYSLTGEVFNLQSQQVAAATAKCIQAEKIIYLTDTGTPGTTPATARQFSWQAAGQFIKEQQHLPTEYLNAMRPAIDCCQHGVRRAHIIDHALDGGLLLELFTRDGVGTLISHDSYEDIHPARLDDIGGLLELIQPLEQKGILLGRSREMLEPEIGRYAVIERDGMIVACSALYPHGTQMELACLAVHPDYQRRGYGDRMLQYSEQQARKSGKNQLYVLTTQATHWFIEREFSEAGLSILPKERSMQTDPGRGAKVLIKSLGSGIFAHNASET